MDLDRGRNEDVNKLAVSKLQRHLDDIYLGGGTRRMEKHRSRGKLTARDRIDYLLDKEKPSFELGALAAHKMYEEHGGAPAAGVIVMLGYIKDRLCIVVANDATVKAGAWFPMAGKKNLRAQEIAMENRIPIIYLVDSAGVYLPMQDEIFPDKEHFGRIFRNNARMSAMGVPQIAAVMGSCVAGGAY
ncbi:MAG: acyl-CoA carboxylase subunit beta, partial [Saprospiraceae bacterium]|nr:acyl-CoA carboxylase subunit beta [Saprospiraceae bacterium]